VRRTRGVLLKPARDVAAILLKSHIEASKAEVRKVTIDMLHTAREKVAQRT
jgi:hypothetical protein